MVLSYICIASYISYIWGSVYIWKGSTSLLLSLTHGGRSGNVRLRELEAGRRCDFATTPALASNSWARLRRVGWCTLHTYCYLHFYFNRIEKNRRMATLFELSIKFLRRSTLLLCTNNEIPCTIQLSKEFSTSKRTLQSKI